MFCKKCGNVLNDGAAFCAKCGAPVENTQQDLAGNDQPAGGNMGGVDPNFTMNGGNMGGVDPNFTMNGGNMGGADPNLGHDPNCDCGHDHTNGNSFTEGLGMAGRAVKDNAAAFASNATNAVKSGNKNMLLLILIPIVIVVILIGVVGFTFIRNHIGYRGALNDYFSAIESGEGDDIEGMLPECVVDDDDELDKWTERVEKIHDIYEDEYGDDFDIDFEIKKDLSDEKKYKDKIKDFKKGIDDKYDIDKDDIDVYVIKYKREIEGDDDEDTDTREAMIAKFDGGWVVDD